jgi:eukaryotic-like serine/threonine-protein kinase
LPLRWHRWYHLSIMRLARRYQVIKTLGHGAGGEVYLARDAFAPGRPVALKTLRVDEGQLVAALRREFQVLAALRHPQLAQVFDFGRIPAEEPGGPVTFMTREYLEGQPLTSAVDGASLRRVAELVIALCRALEPLHQSGLVHGDLKPDNVIVDSGQVRLIDFGLVRSEGESSQLPTGTIPYIAPEVITGQAADPRSDLYSLGVVLYQVLTGEVPFTGRRAR